MVGGLTRGLISMDGRFASFVNAISLELACLGSRTRMERGIVNDSERDVD